MLHTSCRFWKFWDGDYENYQDFGEEEEGQFHFSELRKSKKKSQSQTVSNKPQQHQKSHLICAHCKCPVPIKVAQIILDQSRKRASADRRPLCKNEEENVSNLETMNNGMECRMSINKPQSPSIYIAPAATKRLGMDEILYI